MTKSTIIMADTEFARDVMEGLSSEPKQLSSKYFYDEIGDKLFQQIMRMPEYYLTDCEFEILDTQKDEILRTIGPGHFDLIELGAGDGLKTKLLLEYFVDQEVDFRYCPIDISGHILNMLKTDIKQRWPKMDMHPKRGDYFAMLESLNRDSDSRKVILFMGANIGNLEMGEAQRFLASIHKNMHPGDILIVGFDLKKDPQIIQAAYDDPAGITEAFNLNLLTRMNRELGANFDVNQFDHWETYNPVTGAARSYIVSRSNQIVHFSLLNYDATFSAWEAISVELSQKFSLSEIEDLAAKSGFHVLEHFTDSRDYFVDTIWKK